MKYLCEMIKKENGSYLFGGDHENITAENSSQLKRKALKLIKSGEIPHGYYLAVPCNGRNKVWEL